MSRTSSRCNIRLYSGQNGRCNDVILKISKVRMSRNSDPSTTGSHLGEKASFTHELPRRRQATMAAFYSVGQLWYKSRVSWRLKRCFFISRVVNTALSGIEAFCPSKAQYQALTSLVNCLARRVMAGAAARRRELGRVRANKQGGSAFLETGTV